MRKLKALLLTEGMHGMISQVEGMAKALNAEYIHETVRLNFPWNLVPPKLTPASQIVLETDGSVNYRGFNIDNIELLYQCNGLKGDLDSSGYLNISDVILIVDEILISTDSQQLTNCLADINNDNIINIFDLILVIENILEN